MKKRNLIITSMAICLASASVAVSAAERTVNLVGISDKKDTGADTSETETETETETEKNTASSNGWKVAIDPGHQGNWVDMSAPEPSAPGSSEMKAKATAGTTGRFSNLAEYELNLDVSLVLRDVLEERGYEVVMTREDHDTAISNKERAELAARENADILVRIHANGSDDSSVNGALAMVPSQSNPYVGEMYEECFSLGEAVLKGYCASTGFADLGVQYYDNMSGINWSTIPVTILEMGFMTNQSDDLQMAEETFWPVMAKGIADGIDTYFADKKPEKEEDSEESEAVSAIDMTRVENELAEDLAVRAGAGERWAAAVVDLSTGNRCEINSQPMQAASLIKLFIMGAVYEQYEKLTQSYGQDYIDGLLWDMITVSDNTAANTLTNYLGGGDDAAGRAVVNEYCSANGYQDTTMGRMLLAPADNGDNMTSVSDCSEFLRKVYEEETAHAQEMLKNLKGQQRRHKIPSGLPEGIESASKTGELDTVENDAAIVFAKNPYILCVMSENLSDAGAAQNAIAGISTDVYEMTE